MRPVILGIAVALLAVFGFPLETRRTLAGEPVRSAPPAPQAGQGADAADPFAELIRNNPSEIIKTGPTCKIVKIQLPPGFSPDDIPGLAP